MIYAQINTATGELINFPYPYSMNNPMMFGFPGQLPIDAVQVDTTSTFPSNLNWDQSANITKVVQSENSYVANYEIVDRFSNDADRLQGITQFLQFYTVDNMSRFQQQVSQLSSNYLGEEINSWPIQFYEAQSYQNNTATNTVLLSAIAQARGITVGDLANRVITNYSNYYNSYGELLGKYQKNVEILNSVDVNNTSTWNNINPFFKT